MLTREQILEHQDRILEMTVQVRAHQSHSKLGKAYPVRQHGREVAGGQFSRIHFMKRIIRPELTTAQKIARLEQENKAIQADLVRQRMSKMYAGALAAYYHKVANEPRKGGAVAVFGPNSPTAKMYAEKLRIAHAAIERRHADRVAALKPKPRAVVKKNRIEFMKIYQKKRGYRLPNPEKQPEPRFSLSLPTTKPPKPKKPRFQVLDWGRLKLK